MKKFLALTLSLLILVSTIVVGFTGITASAETNTSVVDLNDASKWVTNTYKPSMKLTEVTEDDFSALKAESADYQSMYAEVELKPSTDYAFLFDFKSSLKIENIQIWPTKCEPTFTSDGSVTYNKENYTTADRILFTGGYDGNNNFSSQNNLTDPLIWYNDNVISFKTNDSDASYRIFFKFNNVVNSEISTAKTFIFKNAYVKQIASATAKAEVKGNGSAAVSKESTYEYDTVTYTATPNEGEMFYGWYKGDTLVSVDLTYETTLSAGENILTARFSTVNLMTLSLWGKSPARPYMQFTEVVEDGYNTIKNYNTQYSYISINMELKPNTEYQIQFDFKSAYRFESYEIWPTRCNCKPNTNGSVGPGDGYTTADRLVINYTYFGDKTDNINWYENNVINFKTNATDFSYQLFFVYAGERDTTTNATKSTFYKNFAVKEKVLASATALGNGSASVSKSEGVYGDEVTYTAIANNGDEFLGWYKGETLVSSDAVYNTTLVSGDNTLTAKFTTINFMNIALWNKSTARPYIKITEVVEDGYNTIKIYDSQYSYVYINMELKPDTEYQIQFDFKSAYKFDCYEIWPTKCNCTPNSNGGVGPGEGYTTSDMLVKNYTYFGDKTDNINWYENNVINFKTNKTDSSYQFFLTFGGVRDSATNSTKSTYFKNFTVKEKVTASATALGNGTATVSKSEGLYGDAVTYTATANNGDEFLGWYKGETLVSSDAIYNTTLVSGDNALVAKFSTNSLMDISAWGESPSRPYIQITEAVEDNYNTIKVYNIQYAYFYVNMELKTNTTYKLSYDYKTDYIPEYVDIWATKCGAKPNDQGNVVAGEGYTNDDKILRKYLSGSYTDNTVWHENNVIEFTTNDTDTSYQFFMKFGGFVNEDAKTTKSVYFKNFKIGDPITASVTATVKSIGNGTATISSDSCESGSTVTLTAKAFSDSLFIGWYDGETLLSKEMTYQAKVIKDTEFTAKFTDENLLLGKNVASNWASAGWTTFSESTDSCYGGSSVELKGIRYQAQYFAMDLEGASTYSLQFSYKTGVETSRMFILDSNATFATNLDGGKVNNLNECFNIVPIISTSENVAGWTDYQIDFRTSGNSGEKATYYFYLDFHGVNISETIGNNAYISDLSLINKTNSLTEFVGTSIRAEGNQGLRFKFDFGANFDTAGYYGYKIKEIGALAIREDYLMYDEILVKDGEYNYNNQTKTPAYGVFYDSQSGINKISEDGIASVVLYNIGYNQSTRKNDYSYYSYAYALRVYMDIEYNGEIRTVYSTMESASVMDVMHEICGLYENAEVTPDAESQLAKDYTSVTAFLNSTATDKNGLTVKQIYDGNRSLGNVMVFGDSYSSFSGFIPSDHSAYYNTSTRSDSDISNPNQMWWQQIINATDSNLLYNTSWSGTTISKNGPEHANKGPAFVDRLDTLIADGYFEENQVDTVFVFGGTNDCWGGRPIGELKFEDWTEEDLKSFAPAVCYMISRLKTVMPNGKIVFLLNDNLKDEINNAMRDACEHYGVYFVELENIDKLNDHPTKTGMTQIREQTLDEIF